MTDSTKSPPLSRRTFGTKDSTPSTTEKELSVMEMTRDLFQSSKPTSSGIDWSLGDSDNDDEKNDGNDDHDDQPSPADDASETEQPAQTLNEDSKDEATKAPATNSNDESNDENDSDDDATIAMDMDEQEEPKPKPSLFDIDLSDEEEEKEEDKSEQPKAGRTRRTSKKVQKAVDSDSEQEFGDEMEADEDSQETDAKKPKAGRTKSKKAKAVANDSDSEQEFGDEIEADDAPVAESPEEEAEEADAEDNGTRRSRRTRKQRNLEIPPEPSRPRKASASAPAAGKKKDKKKDDKKKDDKKKKKSGQEPEQDQLLTSTDYLFLQADKSTVTVKDILKALEAEFDCKLSKPTRKFVRSHLVALISEEVQPSVSLDDVDNDKPKDNDEEEDDNEAQEEEEQDLIYEQGDVESEFEADNDDDDEDFETTKSSKKKNKSSKKSSKTKKESVPRPKRPNKRKAAKAARLVEAMRLRKKRMEELRIRNEEMQLNQTKEDQERAEKIAAKLDTNTEELRLQRLEDRLDLLGKLDQKRIVVLLEEDIVLNDLKKEKKEEDNAAEEKTETDVEEERDPETKKDGEALKATEPEEESSDEESSSDEEDLVIVGATKRIKPLAPLSVHVKASAIDILNRIRSPDRQKQLQKQQQPLGPVHSLNARSALRNSLKQKQRNMGNMWLARELGYKTEQEHLKDCEEAANKKRGLTILREQERIKANERKQLRERLMYEEAPNEENEANLEVTQEKNPEEEDDEEMQMAKEIEKERAAKSAPTESDDEEESAESRALENTESQKTVAKSVTGTDEVPPMQDSQKTRASSTHDDDSEPEDFGPDFSPEEDAQPMEEPELPSTETQEDTPRLETQQPVNAPIEQDSQEDTQRLETQMPPNSGVVREVTAEPGVELSQLSNGVDEESPKEEVVSAAVSPEKSSDYNPEESKDAEESEDDGELEFMEEKPDKSNEDRNAGWKLMLEKEAEKYKKQKRRKGANGLIEQEAEEEEEEEVAGLEDFGFTIKKKNNDDDDEEDPDSLKVSEEDLKHVVDEVSDGEGDEEAGQIARKKQEQREEKERHKEMIRRMREGYDGRRGGIAGGGARGMHRFDQLVAADNREDAKRLGLLNDDELDSDDENNEDKKDDEDEDEAALIDKILKDRFLHRTNVDLENFSDDEEEGNENDGEGNKDMTKEEMQEAEEERTQERLAKRFAKRARMCRLEEMYAESQEFSMQRMIDEDESMKKELSQMTNGLVRSRSTSSRSSFSSNSNIGSTLKRQRSTGSNFNTSLKRQKSTGSTFGGSFLDKGGSLSIALRGNRTQTKHRTSFLGGDKAGDSKNQGASVVKNVALGHVVFKADNSKSSFSNSGKSNGNKRKVGGAGGSFFNRATGKNQ